MKVKSTTIILWFFALLWGGVIFFLSSQDGTHTAEVSSRFAQLVSNVFYENPTSQQLHDIHMIVRRLAHIVLFFVFGILVSSSVRTVLAAAHISANKGGNFLPWMVSCVIITGYGLFDEWHKRFIPGRHFQLEEALLNIICGLAGAITVGIVVRIADYIKERNDYVAYNEDIK